MLVRCSVRNTATRLIVPGEIVTGSTLGVALRQNSYATSPIPTANRMDESSTPILTDLAVAPLLQLSTIGKPDSAEKARKIGPSFVVKWETRNSHRASTQS